MRRDRESMIPPLQWRINAIFNEFAQNRLGAMGALHRTEGMAASSIDERMAQERRARLQAEQLLALRSEELYSANRKLAEHANALSTQVIEQREENKLLKGKTTKTEAQLEVATERAVTAQRRLWDALTATEDGFAIFDRDWRLVAANPAFFKVFDGVADVAEGASYEAILRIAVEEGIVPGGGVAYLRCLKALLALKLEGEQKLGIQIIARALEEPIRQIANNAGLEGSVIVEHVKGMKDAKGFNAETEKFEDLIEAGVIDPAKVTRFALQNAASVAGLLLTTECMIAEKPEDTKAGGGGGAPAGMGGMGGMGGMM